MAAKIQNYINHIVFVVDASGSMRGLSNDVVKVFDGQIAHLSKKSQEMNQETRVSVYLFSYAHDIKCLIYDMDVMRLPSLKEHYHADGNTALVEATVKAIEDLKLTPEIYADHAFLVYVLTDGEENSSSPSSKTKLPLLTEKLKENWTFACLVPDERGREYAVRFGFPVENTRVWSTTSKGMTEIGSVMQTATTNFMTARAKGVRSTKNLFNLDVHGLSTTAVKGTLAELNAAQYALLPVHKDSVIAPFVDSWLKKDWQREYIKGSGYYQLVKAETVQAHKQVILQEKMTGKVYGGPEARQMLGLPDYEVKINPASHPKWNIFVQSTSMNRKLPAGTQLIVLK